MLNFEAEHKNEQIINSYIDIIKIDIKNQEIETIKRIENKESSILKIDVSKEGYLLMYLTSNEWLFYVRMTDF